MIDELIEDLKRDEGWSEKPYLDSLGHQTIGYGFLNEIDSYTPMPEQVGRLWLEIEIDRRWDALMDRIPWVVDQPEDVQRALGNMAYNLGVDGVLKFRRMLAALQVFDRVEAANEALDSLWAFQVPNRANRIAQLIRGY